MLVCATELSSTVEHGKDHVQLSVNDMVWQISSGLQEVLLVGRPATVKEAEGSHATIIGPLAQLFVKYWPLLFFVCVITDSL